MRPKDCFYVCLHENVGINQSGGPQITDHVCWTDLLPFLILDVTLWC